MERLTRRLEDGEVITNCSGCKGNDGLPICHTIKCRNILKDRLADLEDKVEKGELVDAVPVVHGRWIPVTERLPDEGETVLVFGYWHEKFQPLMCYLSPHRKGEWFTTVAGQQVYTVTHWMPMPKPPREASE